VLSVKDTRQASRRNKGKASPLNELDRKMLKNDYFLTLADPFNVRGVGIPDLDAHPSLKFHIVKRVATSTNGFGCGGAIFGYYPSNAAIPYGGLVPTNMTVPAGWPATSPRAPIGFTLSSTAVSTALITGVSFASAGTHGIFYENCGFTNGGAASGVMNYINKLRLVSMGVSIRSLGAPLTSQGTVLIAQAPFGTLAQYSGTAANVNVTAIVNLPGSVLIPLNEFKAGNVLYRPLDTFSTKYTDENISYSLPANSAEYYTDFGNSLLNELYVIVYGTDIANPMDLEIRVYSNFEAIPNTNTLDLATPTVEPIDLQGLGMAMQACQVIPATFSGNALTEGAHDAIKEKLVHREPRNTLLQHARQIGSFAFSERERRNPVSKLLGGLTDQGFLNTVADVVKFGTPIIKSLLR